MNLERFEKIEALVSIIEEQNLLIAENKALTTFYHYLETNSGEIFANADDELSFYWFRRDIIQWVSWLNECLNAYTHNLLFYERRLEKLLSEE